MESKENTSITDAGEETGKKKAIKPWIIGLAAVAIKRMAHHKRKEILELVTRAA